MEKMSGIADFKNLVYELEKIVVQVETVTRDRHNREVVKWHHFNSNSIQFNSLFHWPSWALEVVLNVFNKKK